MKQIRLAAAQFELTDDMEHNLENIDQLSKKASDKDARLVLFPECAVTGYPGTDMGDLSRIDPNTVQEALERLAEPAGELKIYIATGVALPTEKGNDWINTLIVFDEMGRRVCTYSKTALTHSDKSFFIPGDSEPVFILDGLKFGCQICFDVRFAEGYCRLFRQGVHVVLHSYHQAGSQYWRQRRDVMTAFQRIRCSENGIYAVTSNTIGHNRGEDQ